MHTFADFMALSANFAALEVAVKDGVLAFFINANSFNGIATFAFVGFPFQLTLLTEALECILFYSILQKA